MKNFNININYKPTFFKLLFLIVVFSFHLLLTGEVLCDDGLIPINENDYNAATSYNTNSWENHYQNRVTLPESYARYNERGPIYQAYNEGLQQTSQGYRYELGGGHGDINLNPTVYTLDGRPLPIEYKGLDNNGNPIYHYTYPTTNSTQLGEISPTRSEVLNDNFYYGSGYKIPLDTSKTSFKDRFKNKVKTSIKNHIAKSSDESLRQDRIRSEITSRRLYEYKKVARAHDTRHTLDVAYRKNRISYPKKVRTFD